MIVFTVSAPEGSAADAARIKRKPAEARGFSMRVAVLYNVKLQSNIIVSRDRFRDFNEIGNIAAVQSAINAGFLSTDGMGNGTFGPNSHMTRAQAAMLQSNLIAVLNRLD